MFRALRVRNFRRFASANLVSNTGTYAIHGSLTRWWMRG